VRGKRIESLEKKKKRKEKEELKKNGCQKKNRRRDESLTETQEKIKGVEKQVGPHLRARQENRGCLLLSEGTEGRKEP